PWRPRSSPAWLRTVPRSSASTSHRCALLWFAACARPDGIEYPRMNMSDSMRVIIAGPGGLEHGGGIGRMMGYLVDALPHVDEALELRVVDTPRPGHTL